MVEQALLLTLPAPCIISNKNLPHFIPLYADCFGITNIYEYKDHSLLKQIDMTLLFYQLNFQQFQAILGGNK